MDSHSAIFKNLQHRAAPRYLCPSNKKLMLMKKKRLTPPENQHMSPFLGDQLQKERIVFQSGENMSLTMAESFHCKLHWPRYVFCWLPPISSDSPQIFHADSLVG